MPDESVNCIVTSAPYWAKRDYGVPGQYGHEPGPDAYIATLRSVFAEARRVLTGDGTCWLNLGDSYWAGSATSSRLHAYIGAGLAGRHTLGMGTKNLLGLPWRTALALQDDGWILRNAIVWHKPNAMPESVRDRLNCRHEMIFLLVKSRHYWFDLDPIRIPHATLRPQNHVSQPDAGGTSARRPPHAPSSTRRPGGTTRPPKYGPHTRQVIAARRYGNDRGHAAHPLGRNPGDVWSIPPAPTGGRTSPRSPSTSRCAASRQAARRAVWSSTRSAAPVPPGSPPWPSAGSSPASTSTRRLPPWPTSGYGKPPSPATRAATNERHAGPRKRHAGPAGRHATPHERHAAAPSYRQAT